MTNATEVVMDKLGQTSILDVVSPSPNKQGSQMQVSQTNLVCV